METTTPNFLAIIVMALVYMGIGWLWYSPKLFGNMISCPTKMEGRPETRVDGKTDEDKMCCWKSYVGEFVLACIIGYVLSLFAIAMSFDTFVQGVKLGFWSWLGFVATTMFSKVLWTHKPIVNFYISAGFYLLMLVLMGGVLAVWHHH